jgi:hypothetical protein
MWCFILFVAAFCNSQNISYQYQELGFNAPIGALFLYQVIPPYPTLGKLWYRNEILQSPYLFNSTSDLVYVSNNEEEFQTISSNQTSIRYDSFNILVTVVTAEETIKVNSSVNVTISDMLVDMVQNLTKVHTNEFTGLLEFTIDINLRPRKGTLYNETSQYAFYNPDNYSEIYNGISFNTTCNTIGCLTDSNGIVLVPGVKYKRSSFFTSRNGTGSGVFKFDLYGRINTLIDTAYLTLRSFQVNATCSTCLVVLEEETNKTFTSFFDITGDGNTTFLYQINRIPEQGVVKNGEDVVSVGMELSHPLNLTYVPPANYFNQFLFPNGTTSVNFSDSVPIWDCGVNLVCTQSIAFTLVPSSGIDTFGPQIVEFVVQRHIIEDVLYACSQCTVQGDGPGAFIFYLTVDDGRETPEPLVQFISLPSHGTIYNYGTIVTNGSIISFREMELSYIPDTGYFNRYYYQSAPNITLGLVSDIGDSPPSTDLDSFRFQIYSQYFNYLTPQQGQVDIIVSYEPTNLLTSCPVDVTNATTSWEESCIAFGIESNSIFGEYATPIVLTVSGNNESEEVEFHIVTVPRYGDLYINLGTFDDPIFGQERLHPLSVVTTRNLVYSGNSDYANQLASRSSNLLDEPFGGCNAILTQGCPDTFTFYSTTNRSRQSQVATYQIYIIAMASESAISSPETILVPTGDTMINVPVNYTDVDNGEAYVMVQIVSYDMKFGVMNVNLSRLPDCMYILNCSESYFIPVIDKQVSQFLSNIYVVPTPNITIDDEDMIVIAVYKRPEIGIDPDAYFFIQDTDHVYATDSIIYFADESPIDDYYSLECDDEFCSEYYKQDLAIVAAENNNRLIIIIGASVGSGVGVLLILGLLYYWEFRKTTTVSSKVQVQPIGGNPSKRSKEIGKTEKKSCVIF